MTAQERTVVRLIGQRRKLEGQIEENTEKIAAAMEAGQITPTRAAAITGVNRPQFYRWCRQAGHLRSARDRGQS